MHSDLPPCICVCVCVPPRLHAPDSPQCCHTSAFAENRASSSGRNGAIEPPPAAPEPLSSPPLPLPLPPPRVCATCMCLHVHAHAQVRLATTRPPPVGAMALQSLPPPRPGRAAALEIGATGDCTRSNTCTKGNGHPGFCSGGKGAGEDGGTHGPDGEGGDGRADTLPETPRHNRALRPRAPVVKAVSSWFPLRLCVYEEYG
jgi:hypothetical protein